MAWKTALRLAELAESGCNEPVARGSPPRPASLPGDVGHAEAHDLLAAAGDGGGQNLVDVGLGDAAVPEVVGPDGDGDAAAAVLEAAGAGDHHPVAHAELADAVLEAVVDAEGAAERAAGLRSVGRALVEADQDLDVRVGHGGRILSSTIDPGPPGEAAAPPVASRGTPAGSHTGRGYRNLFRCQKTHREYVANSLSSLGCTLGVGDSRARRLVGGATGTSPRCRTSHSSL